MNLSEFLEILSLVPNLEHLDIERLDLREKDVVRKRRKTSNDNDLDLHQLKKLCFRGNNIVERDEFLAIFKRLPVGVLTELKLSSFKFNAAFVLFQRQTNIIKLEMTGFVFKASDPIHILDDLQLESLVISSYSNNGEIERFLSNQTQLKSLTIPYADATEDCLNFVANHQTELETLSITISTAPSASCKANISKMKSLHHLSVFVNEDTATNQLESLTEYPHFGITSLSLHDRFLNVNLVQALAKSLTKLKAFKLYVYHNTEIVNTIMSNFNFVEVLHIRGDVDGYHTSVDGDCFNPKLTELIAPLPKNAPKMYLNKLIADYPNLKKFQIDWDLITSSQFRLVLNGFTKLESLTFIGSAERLTMDDLNYLTDHKYNLKFVSLGGLRIRFTDELKRRLSATFGVIICNDYIVRIMAVDRQTMNRERKSTEKGLICPDLCQKFPLI